MVSDRENFNVVILAGSRDFGRCPIASRLPTALWPVLQQPAAELVLNNLYNQGIEDICVCSEGDFGSFKDLTTDMPSVQLKFLDEPLRVGTAGCIRDAAEQDNQGGLIVAVPAAMVFPPDIKSLVRAHVEQKGDMTVFLNPDCDNNSTGTSAGIYVCDRAILKHIPKDGYCDIKEWLIPELLQCGKIVKAVQLNQKTGSFRDGHGYLRAIQNYLGNGIAEKAKTSMPLRKTSQCVWINDAAEVDPKARFFGPVAVMTGARISEDTIIFGPSVIGRNCIVGPGSVILNSVLWDGAQIGVKCEIRNSLLDYEVNIKDKKIIRNEVIAFKKSSIPGNAAEKISKSVLNNIHDLADLLRRAFEKTSIAGFAEGHIGAWFAGTLIVAAFIWSYWSNIVDLWNIWLRSDEYSSGLLVPFLAAYILWARRDKLKDVPIKPAMAGLIGILFAESLRFFGTFYMFGSAQRLAIVVCIVSLVLFLLGWQFFKRIATIMLFLFLMLPWPNRVQAAVSLPLQRWATSSAVFCLEMFGYDIVQEGNIIHIGQANVAAAEACNGLRMITAFFVISAFFMLLVKRKWWEKLIVLASSLPVALLCNTMRLSLTSMVFTVVEGDYWEKFFHDFGGYAMMPVALAVIVGELWLLKWLTVPPQKKEPVIITR